MQKVAHMGCCGVTVAASNDIPMDDVQIAHALEAVDQRLDAFIQVLRDMQVHTAPPSSCITTESEQAKESIETETSLRSSVENEAKIRQPDEPAPALVETATPSSEPIDTKSAHRAKEEAENAQTTTLHGRDQSADVKLRPSECNESRRRTRTPSKEEDESLLASLDEETAAAISVMRRLSMGTKTVRELLDEYKAMREDDKPDCKDNRPRKSWFWKRGQEDE